MRHLATWLVIGSVALSSACADPALEQRLAELETKVEALESAPAAAAPGEAAEGPSAQDEEAAATLLREANDLVQAMDYTGAKAKLTELNTNYGQTRAARSSRRLVSELEVVGNAAGEIEVEKWFQGNTSMSDGKATLVVFWELWCPHCRREMPEIEETWAQYRDDGLNMVAVTKITRSATEESVAEFIEEHDISYPVAKETGSMSTRFGVRGIPAAAVVKDGEIVWRGHPARLTDEMYRSWLN